MDREQRVVENENLFRQVNERIRDLESAAERSKRIDFICECGDASCMRVVSLTAADYERIRSSSLQFVVLPGHELPDVEIVVERHHDHLVVRKHPHDARASDRG